MAEETQLRLMALAGQLQTLLFQIDILKRCDPEILLQKRLRSRIKHNALMALYIHSLLSNELSMQVNYRLTLQTYCVWLWLRRACSEIAALCNEIDKYSVLKDRKCFFEATLGYGKGFICPLHAEVQLQLYGMSSIISKELVLINDVENFMKQLNYCHCVVSCKNAIEALNTIDEFLVLSSGGSLVAAPDTYDHGQPCYVCLEELSVTANQGETIYRRLGYKICDHLTRQFPVNVSTDDLKRHLPFLRDVDPEKLKNVLSNETRIEAENHVEAGRTLSSSPGESEASKILNKYDVFTEPPGPVYQLSELQYWLASGKRTPSGVESQTTTSQSVLKQLDKDLSELFKRAEDFEQECIRLERTLFEKVHAHFHRVAQAELISPQHSLVDTLITGVLATSPDTEIAALIKACYDHHLSLPLFRRLRNPEKVDTDALEELVEKLRSSDKETQPVTEGTSTSDLTANLRGTIERDEDSIEVLLKKAERDLDVRQKNYVEKLSARSFSNLDRCIKIQRAELEKLMRVNIYGETLPVMYVTLKNAFLARRAFLDIVCAEESLHSKILRIDQNDGRAYDWHQYIRSSITRYQIDQTMLPRLTNRFFEILSGPLFKHHKERFPQPPNTSIYFSVENVGLLPHLKEELANFTKRHRSCDWMTSEFRRFYNFAGISNSTAIQRAACGYIREALFATTAFEKIFHSGNTKLLRADCVEFDLDGPILENGLYLTFEEEHPLVAVWGVDDRGKLGPASTIIVEKDLYAVLYAILHRREH
ncbi:DNA packaging terminase subunit 2 [Gallid alphaherpesvirus 1]|nr:DNA packaging terminase subunit 2 [Gallid alphaherpesvirus 1]